MQITSIAEWLASLGLAQYADAFAAQEIDVSVLEALSDQDLKDLGVSLLGHRRKLMLAIAERRSAAAAPETSTRDASAAFAEPAPAVVVERSPPEADAAERRHLTVMFCDLVGSTALAARLDPEDVREVVRAYQGACAKVIARYEGFVAQYLGDGIIAYFGYPRAHEDDAERAVRAGLDLIAAVARLDTKAKIEVRTGVATGLVVVGDLIGEHAVKERAVTGETPNLAARLQGLAAPGAIVVSAATRRLLGGQFELRDLGARQVKGLEAPVQAFAVEGVRSFESRFEARAGGFTGFVGREEECEHLLARWKLARQGRGQVIVVCGEAGIGKSRLTAWLADEMAGEPHMRLRYQCTPHHKDSALYPVIVQIERAAGFAASDTPAQKRAKLEAVVALPGLDGAAVVPLFGALLAIPPGERYPPLAMSPGQQRQRTLAAMLDQIEALARQKPLLMIHEDAHWADPTSLDLLDMLVERLARLPVLLVVTGRPEFEPAWAGRHNVSTLSLQKLDRRQTRAIVDSMTGGADLPPDILEQIVAKTDGVPLFVEELTKSVLESGALVEDGRSLKSTSPLPIPATLQDSLMARLDRANPVKEIAQIGAAIGREFSYKLLVTVAGLDETALRGGLAQLEETDLATRRGVPPEATYTFKHALVQDAAYESLLKSRRQTIHRRIAKALRDRFAEQAETEPEIVAHHFARAGRIEEAVTWGAKAGEFAVRRSAFVEAISHFEKAIVLADILADAPAPRLRLHAAHARALMAAHGHGALRATDAFARSAELATQLQDTTERFTALNGIWVGSFVRGEAFRARELAEAFRREAKRHGLARESALGEAILGCSLMLQGRPADALARLDAALADYDEDRDMPQASRFGQDDFVVSSVYAAMSLWLLGRVDEARARADAAAVHASKVAQIPTFVNVHFNKGVFEMIRGDATRTMAHAEALAAISHEHELPLWQAAARLLRAWAGWASGNREAGWSQVIVNRAVPEDQRPTFAAPAYAAFAVDAIAGGNPKAAIAVLDSMLATSSQNGVLWGDADLHRQRGAWLLAGESADPRAAEAALRQAIAVAREQQARSYELRAALDLGCLYRATGRKHDAREVLAPALVGFTESAELREIGEAQQLLAELT